MFPPIENRLHTGACFSLPSDTNFYFSPTPPFCPAAYSIRILFEIFDYTLMLFTLKVVFYGYGPHHME